mgnify:CR=1 FL=1
MHSSVPRADFFESKGDDAAAALAGLSVKRLIALAAAKEKLYGLRKTPEARREAGSIQQQHGSRKSGLPQSGTKARRSKPADERQGQLF